MLSRAAGNCLARSLIKLDMNGRTCDDSESPARSFIRPLLAAPGSLPCDSCQPPAGGGPDRRHTRRPPAGLGGRPGVFGPLLSLHPTGAVDVAPADVPASPRRVLMIPPATIGTNRWEPTTRHQGKTPIRAIGPVDDAQEAPAPRLPSSKVRHGATRVLLPCVTAGNSSPNLTLRRQAPGCRLGPRMN